MSDESSKDKDPEEPKAGEASSDSETNGEKEPPAHHDDVVAETEHTVTIGGTEIAYTATASHLVVKEEEGKKQATFFSVAYTKDDVENVTERPIIFSFNGGPGSASVWLHLGAFGPYRVELADDGMALPPPGRLVENTHSLLDIADLVFIDPISTGYSRSIPEEDAKDFHHFSKDIESVGEFVRLWLTRNARWGSPKFLAGESYGTTRSAGLAGHLLKKRGMYFNGLILVSSILNFQTAGFDSSTWTFRRGNDLPYVGFLPTYAATAHYHRKLDDRFLAMPLRTFLDEVEDFAQSDYAQALMAGSRLESSAYDDIVSRVSGYTGLSEQYVRDSDLRIEILRFCKELLRSEQRTVGRIDGRYKGIDRFQTGQAMESDPSIDATIGRYTATFNHYVRTDLDYESDLPYEVLTDRVHPWDYEDFKNSYVDVSKTLRETMSRNPFMKVFVANGYYDLATPHFATEYTFAHLGLDPELNDNVTMAYYEAGHMMYVHLESLAKLKTDIAEFVASALA